MPQGPRHLERNQKLNCILKKDVCTVELKYQDHSSLYFRDSISRKKWNIVALAQNFISVDAQKVDSMPIF
jgi:hypothetical protein